MGNIQWDFLLLATFGAFSIIAIGISIAENSIIGILVSIIILIITMGVGFIRKSKLKNNHE